MEARLRDGCTQTEPNTDPSQLQDLATQLAEMSKEMREEKEDLMQIVEPVSRMVKPKMPRGTAVVPTASAAPTTRQTP